MAGSELGLDSYRLFVCGGVDIQEGTRDSLYSADLNSETPQWTQLELKGSQPGKCSNGASVLVGKQWILLGGIIQSDQTADVYTIDLESLTCEKRPAGKGAGPKPLDSHTAVMSAEGKIVVFGGYVGARRSAQSFEYDSKNNFWREISPKNGTRPAPRAGHSAIFFEGAMYVFGGTGEDGEPRNDLWKFDLATETWTEIQKPKDPHVYWPQGRAGHSAVLDSAAGIMYIFGGNLGLRQETNDLVGLNLRTLVWSMISSPARQLYPEPKTSKDSPRSKRRISPDVSPRARAMTLRDASGRHSPDSGKNRGSPRGGSPRHMGTMRESPRLKAVSKRAAEKIEALDKEREDLNTPIVVAMHNSIVMKATSSTRRKPVDSGVEDEEERITNGQVLGSFPCGRDGYAAQVQGGKLWIFGGDRFQMAYNDLYSYTL